MSTPYGKKEIRIRRSESGFKIFILLIPGCWTQCPMARGRAETATPGQASFEECSGHQVSEVGVLDLACLVGL